MDDVITDWENCDWKMSTGYGLVTYPEWCDLEIERINDARRRLGSFGVAKLEVRNNECRIVLDK